MQSKCEDSRSLFDILYFNRGHRIIFPATADDLRQNTREHRANCQETQNEYHHLLFLWYDVEVSDVSVEPPSSIHSMESKLLYKIIMSLQNFLTVTPLVPGMYNDITSNELVRIFAATASSLFVSGPASPSVIDSFVIIVDSRFSVFTTHCCYSCTHLHALSF